LITPILGINALYGWDLKQESITKV